MSYIGNGPVGDSGFFKNYSEAFSGNGSNTVFTLTYRVAGASDIEVLVDNVQKNPYDGSYTVSNTNTLTFTSAPSAGSNNIVVYYRSFAKPVAYNNTVNVFFTSANSTITVETAVSVNDATIPTSNSTVKGVSFVVDSTTNTSITAAASANSVKTVYEHANTVAGITYTNAVSFANTIAATAYSNAASYADTVSGAAYTNAVSFANSIAATAYTNAASYADAKAANAYSNAASYADAKAANAYSNVFQGGTFSGPTTFQANLVGNNVSLTGSLQIDGNLTVSGNTITLSTKSLAVKDNMIYLNNGIEATITNISGNGTVVTFTANNNFANNWDVFVSNVTPSSYNGTYSDIIEANATHFTVANTNTDSYVSGGLARGKTDANPDLGFAAGYNDGNYRHAGLFRDATDGIWKFFHQYQPEPDASVFIDTSNNTFALANVQANTFIGAGSFSDVVVSANVSVGNSTVNTIITGSSINTNGTLTANTIVVGNVEQTQTNLQVDPAGTAFLNALIYG